MGAATRMFMDVFSPIQVEALARRVGLELVVDWGLIKIDIESDVLQIISAVEESLTNLSPMGPIIDDTKFLMSMVAEASVAQIRRHANSVTHCLARFVLYVGEDCTWVDEPPIIISVLIVEDASLPCTN